jgi:hypothetical protein
VDHIQARPSRWQGACPRLPLRQAPAMNSLHPDWATFTILLPSDLRREKSSPSARLQGRLSKGITLACVRDATAEEWRLVRPPDCRVSKGGSLGMHYFIDDIEDRWKRDPNGPECPRSLLTTRGPELRHSTPSAINTSGLPTRTTALAASPSPCGQLLFTPPAF